MKGNTMMQRWNKRQWAIANINFQNNVSPKLNNVSPKVDSHHFNDPLLTELQEIIFDLYDEENFEYARRLEDFEISFMKYLENNS
jgi:hypothetical protein